MMKKQTQAIHLEYERCDAYASLSVPVYNTLAYEFDNAAVMADNNVPVGESIQLYTVLKLLGRPTAMVLVDGQDHHIIDYEKRLKWQNTIFAWFAKWLQNDASWWTEMYGDEKM
jgi:hypothetical protein